MARIENHKYTIEEAFRECFYEVPDYQREYVWSQTEVQQLVDDIDEQLESVTGREYFVGTILVAPTSQKNHFEVIDGQQRLTTFFLLLCALRNLLADDPQQQHALFGLISTNFIDNAGNVKQSLKLTPRYEGAEPLFRKLVELNTDPETLRAQLKVSGISTFGSLDNLLQAYATLHKALAEKYPAIENLRKFWGNLANNVVFIQISTDVSSALKIFETINERGVGLNSMDLLKNLLFTQVQGSEFNRLKNEWKKITKPLEKAREKPLRFLRYFLMANYNIRNKRGDGVVREDEIYDWFSDKENSNLCKLSEEPFAFVAKVVTNVERHLALASGRAPDCVDSSAMKNLKRLGGAGFSMHHIILLAASNFPPTLFEHLVRQLECFLFYYIFTKTPTKDLERNFSAWADELRAIGLIGHEDKQISALNAFVQERFQRNMATKEQDLFDSLRRYNARTMQLYRTRYFLAKLSQYVDMAYKGITKPGLLDEYLNFEIEHVLPVTPEEDLTESFSRTSVGFVYDEQKIRLGNLTLLEKPINIVASNSFFTHKKDEYQKSKLYLTSSIGGLSKVGVNTSISRINQELIAFEKWDVAAITKRQEMLVNMASNVWKLSALQV